MKKVGIVTIHKINNYGAVAQAYALNKYLRSQGFDTKTIDFRTDRVAESYQLYRSMQGVMDIVRNLQAFIYSRKLGRRNRRFDAFLEEMVPMTEQPYYSDAELKESKLDFDCYVCGSDQIWNTFCKNYNDAFLLSFARNKGTRISYAASLGAASVHEDMEAKFRYELSDYEAVSVREKDAVDVIVSLCNKEVTHVADPVFLLGEEEWSRLATQPLQKKPYIFFYFVKGDLPGMRDYVKKLSRKLDMPVVVVNMNLREMLYRNVKMYDAGPREFISLIKNSAYVCTNSFHATAFSVIFRKKFMIFTQRKDGASSRLLSLVNMLGLSDRVADPDTPIERITETIDFNRAYEKLVPFINKSKGFVISSLNKEQYNEDL